MKKYLILALALTLASSAAAAGVSNGAPTVTGSVAGASSAVTVKTDPTLQLLNPTGHEFYYMGAPIRIRWQASSDFGNVKIEWREPITTGHSGTIAVVPAGKGFYDWTPTAEVGVVPADTYSIWIYSVDKPQTVRTQSTFPFSIKASATEVPTINLLSPKSGEVWHRGETKWISWNTKNVPADAKINIRLIDTTSGKVSEILTRVPNTGSASWKVDKKKDVSTNMSDLVPFGKYKVRACIAGILGGCDKTGGDVNVEIVPANPSLAASVIQAIRSLFGF